MTKTTSLKHVSPHVRPEEAQTAAPPLTVLIFITSSHELFVVWWQRNEGKRPPDFLSDATDHESVVLVTWQAHWLSGASWWDAAPRPTNTECVQSQAPAERNTLISWVLLIRPVVTDPCVTQNSSFSSSFYLLHLCHQTSNIQTMWQPSTFLQNFHWVKWSKMIRWVTIYKDLAAPNITLIIII